MSTSAANTRCTIIPSLRYRDALAAIDWLCRAFGFEKHAVHADGDIVHHAQLVFGNGMIMLGSVANESAWGERIAQPDEIGGRETQCPCVIVADCAAHSESTLGEVEPVAHGAADAVVIPPLDEIRGNTALHDEVFD